MKSTRSVTALGLTFILTFGVFACAPAPASAQALVYDAAAFIQKEKNNLQTALALYNQFVTLKNQFTELQKETQQLKAGATWAGAQQSLANLNQVMETSINLTDASSNLATDFGKAFPTFGNTSKYVDSYARIANQSLAQTRQALFAAGAQKSMLQNESGVMQSLESLSDGSVGHLQAVQAGNKIALMGISEMQNLRTLLAAEVAQSAAFKSGQISNEANEKDKIRQMWAGNATTTPPKGP